MSRRISVEEHIEQFFRTAKLDACSVQREKIELIMRIRFPETAPAKRGRPRTPKPKPPITPDEGLNGGAQQGVGAKSDRVQRPANVAGLGVGE